MLVKLPGIAPTLPADTQAYYPRYIRPQYFQFTANESQGMPAAAAQAAAVKTFGDLPLIVLSARLNKMPGWREWQSELLRLSSNSQQGFAEKSDHNIQVEQPDAVIAAILKMVALVRSNIQP